MSADHIRVPLVVAGTRPELKELETRILQERGRISPLYQVLLNSAPLAQGWESLLTAVRNRSSVPADLRELINAANSAVPDLFRRRAEWLAVHKPINELRG